MVGWSACQISRALGCRFGGRALVDDGVVAHLALVALVVLVALVALVALIVLSICILRAVSGCAFVPTCECVVAAICYRADCTA